jgi:hypothetical protein
MGYCSTPRVHASGTGGAAGAFGTIAETIQPSPVLRAIGNVAALTAMAAQMMLRPVVSAPGLGTSGGVSGGGNIHVHYQPNITVNGGSGSPGDWKQAMRGHSDELVR